MDKFKKIMSWQIIKFILLPIGLFVDGLHVPGRSIWKKFLVILAVIFVSWSWIGSFITLGTGVRSLMFRTGLFKDHFKMPVSGTSMLPTIQDNSTVELTSPGGHTFTRGDLVTFTNVETNGSNYLKRIVGMPGDQILVKNGIVFINGKPLGESYINLNSGTYGNTFLLECQSQKIPDGQYAVMGDNRTVSWDSRAIGFVNESDIKGYIDPKERPIVGGNVLPKVSDDYKIDPSKVLSLINAKRQENKIDYLMPSDTLSEIAKKRSSEVSDNLDNWKSNQLPVEKILDGLNYRYNLAYEFVTFGYLNENDIVNQIMANPDAKNAILSGKFLEAGVGFTEVTNGDCKYPVISLILAWPSIPTYSKDTIDWWSNESTATSQILASLQSWVGYSGKDQAQLKESINLTAQMNIVSTRIVKKMKNKEWLSQQDYTDINNYKDMLIKNNQIQDILFPKIQGVNTQTQPSLL